MKSSLKTWLDRGALATGLIPWLEGQMRRGVTALMYHRVLPDEACEDYPLSSLVMPVSAFRGQMELLSKRYTTGPLGSSLERLRETMDRPLVAITFDDGYRDNLEHAAPILEEFGLRATFFAATNFVGEGQLMWFDEVCLLLAALGPARARETFSPSTELFPETARDWMPIWKALQPAQRDQALEDWRRAHRELSGGQPLDPGGFAPMSPEELRALHERGHEIASHTCSHALLDQVAPEDLAQELERSRAQIEGWIGAPVPGFCYPNGNHNDEVRRAVARAGYEWACTTRSGRFDPGGDAFLIPRLDIAPGRVLNGAGGHDRTRFRAELCRLHEHLQRGRR